MERIGSIFAHNLKEGRRKCGLTQSQLAEKVEVSTHHIAMIELARHCPTFDLVERIANALSTEIYQLFVESLPPQMELEKLRRSIVEEVKQTVDSSIQKALSGECIAKSKT